MTNCQDNVLIILLGSLPEHARTFTQTHTHTNPILMSVFSESFTEIDALLFIHGG